MHIFLTNNNWDQAKFYFCISNRNFWLCLYLLYSVHVHIGTVLLLFFFLSDRFFSSDSHLICTDIFSTMPCANAVTTNIKLETKNKKHEKKVSGFFWFDINFTEFPSQSYITMYVHNIWVFILSQRERER